MFQCEPCVYFTADRCDYNRHILTKKHIKTTSHGQQPLPIFECSVCGKVYKSRAGLWKHRTKYNCVIGKPGNPGDLETDFAQMETKNTADLISVLKEQLELQRVQNERQRVQNEQQRVQNEQQQSQINQMFELLSKAINTNTSVTMTNSNNNNNITNNVNVFLQQRKDTAVDWKEFVKGLKVPMELTLSPDEKYASVFIYNLGTLNPEEYPIYCKDKKRMEFVMMVDNEWQNGDEKNMEPMFDNIQAKHMLNNTKWEKDNTNWGLDDNNSEEHMKALNQIMEGVTLKTSKHKSINILSDAINIKDAMLKA